MYNHSRLLNNTRRTPFYQKKCFACRARIHIKLHDFMTNLPTFIFMTTLQCSWNHCSSMNLSNHQRGILVKLIKVLSWIGHIKRNFQDTREDRWRHQLVGDINIQKYLMLLYQLEKKNSCAFPILKRLSYLGHAKSFFLTIILIGISHEDLIPNIINLKF